MSAASFTPAMGDPEKRSRRSARQPGATALASSRQHPRHVLGNALRVAKVFGTTAFGVIVLGQSDQDAGVYRRAAKPSRAERVVPQGRSPSSGG